MRRFGAILVLITGLAAVAVAVRAGDGEIIRDVFYGFSNGEQRLIRTMTAQPDADGEFKGGLQRILDAKGDAARLEEEKLRFRLQWRGKVSAWASGYASGDNGVLSRMTGMAKPSRESFAKAAPWMAKIDADVFSGGIYDGVIGKMNPYEAAYSIAGLQGLTPQQAAAAEKKLRDNSNYPTRLVAGFILDDTRQKLSGDLKDVQAAYARDKKTVLAQLQGLEAKLQLAKNRVNPEDAREADAAFDGAAADKGEGAVPVDTKQPPVVPGPAPDGIVPPHQNEGKGEEARAAAETGALKAPRPQTPNLSAALDIPPPKTDDNAFASRKGSSGAGIGTMIKEVFKKPAVAMGVGVLLGGVLGFLLGGPIGAAIGVAIGAAGGGMAAGKLKE